jgi:hypothetical protein
MGAVELAIDEIERIAGRDVQQRNIGPLVALARGNLAAAARSIAGHARPSIAIITGFFLRHGEPPNCETDGPPGAAMLAAAFAALGIPCRVATDSCNARVLAATLAGAGIPAPLPLDIVSPSPDCGDGGQPVEALRQHWLGAFPPISHVIAIERCGPGTDGRARNARGDDITDDHAPLHELFAGGAWATIGIGDLGNELGMGSLPHELVAASVANGGGIWCRIGCDYPIVAGVSNWAAAALLGAVALLHPAWAPAILPRLAPQFACRLLLAAVRDGAAVSSDRDGGLPRPRLAVDGISWDVLEETYRQIYELCRACCSSTRSDSM